MLLTEANSSRAIALDSVTFKRDPFSVDTIYNLSSDQHTRIMLFATNLELLPGETISAVTAQAETQGGAIHPLTVEFVGKVPGLNSVTQINVRLPDGLDAAGDVQVSISLRGVRSNKVLVSITASPMALESTRSPSWGSFAFESMRERNRVVMSFCEFLPAACHFSPIL